MVFAFAGDSTITKFLAIYSSHNLRTKHLPGKARTRSLISNDNNAAVNSETASLLFSINQSTCAGLSGVNNLKTEVSVEESPSGTSDNRSEIVFSFLIGGGNNFAAICCGNSAAMSCHCWTSFAPAPLIRQLVPNELRDVMLPGTANTSRFCSIASRAVIKEPEFSAASTTTMPRLSPLMMRLRYGKFSDTGGVFNGNCVTMAPPFANISAASFA